MFFSIPESSQSRIPRSPFFSHAGSPQSYPPACPKAVLTDDVPRTYAAVQQISNRSPFRVERASMNKAGKGDHSAHLAGFGRLATAAVAGVAGVAEAVHCRIAFPSGALGMSSGNRFAPGIAALVYGSIRGIAGLVENSFAAMPPGLPVNEQRLSPGHQAVLAAVNGVVGDYLVKTNNPLAISMSLRRNGRPIEVERHSLKAAMPKVSGKVLLLVHGLCLNDLQWRRNGRNLGATLARELGYSPLYLHYNSGLHVSENGQPLAALLERLSSSGQCRWRNWPSSATAWEDSFPEVPTTMEHPLAIGGLPISVACCSWEHRTTELRSSG